MPIIYKSFIDVYVIISWLIGRNRRTPDEPSDAPLEIPLKTQYFKVFTLSAGNHIKFSLTYNI